MDQWMKRYRIFSRTMLLISIAQMLWVTWWSTRFAMSSTLNGMEVAGVIAAVQVPVTMLFNSVYRTYKESTNA
jgi:hypothetical protein